MHPTPEFATQAPPSGQPVCILLLEDDPISVDIVGAYLRSISFADVKLHSAATASEALALLASVDVDLVVADLNLPDSAGAATVASLVQAVGCPVIAITADAREAAALGLDQDPAVDAAEDAGSLLHIEPTIPNQRCVSLPSVYLSSNVSVPCLPALSTLMVR